MEMEALLSIADARRCTYYPITTGPFHAAAPCLANILQSCTGNLLKGTAGTPVQSCWQVFALPKRMDFRQVSSGSRPWLDTDTSQK
eukprot:6189963-Pleurochrysis_carterae.AAC.2